MKQKRILAGLLTVCLLLCSSCTVDVNVNVSQPSSQPTSSVTPSDTSTDTLSSEQVSSDPSSEEVSSEVSSEISSEISSEVSSEVSSDKLSPDSSSNPSSDSADKTPLFNGDLTADEIAAFENCAFIGNSLMDGIYGYNIIPTADFYTRTSLNVKSVYTTSTKTGKKPIMEMVDPKNGAPSYEKIFLLFGVNEPGYSDKTIKEYYSKIVQDLHKMHPDADVYVLSVFPITRNRSDQNKYGLSNKRINNMNIAIWEMCRENNATYLDIHSKLADENGELPASEASSDGVHFKKSGYAYIAECVYDLTFGN